MTENVLKFYVVDYPNRTAAGQAAQDYMENGDPDNIPRKYRWNREEQCYELTVVDWVPPTVPYDMMENKPDGLGSAPRRRNDTDPELYTTAADAILNAPKLLPFQWMNIVYGERQTKSGDERRKEIQAALDIQYGLGYYWAYNHGNALSIQRRWY